MPKGLFMKCQSFPAHFYLNFKHPISYHDLKYYALGTNCQSWQQSYPALAQENAP
jgi:hypothetical protein